MGLLDAHMRPTVQPPCLHRESSPAPSGTSSGAVPRRPTLLRTCLRAGQEDSPTRQPLPPKSPNDKPTPCILSGSSHPKANARTAHKQVTVCSQGQGVRCVPRAQGHATVHIIPRDPRTGLSACAYGHSTPGPRCTGAQAQVSQAEAQAARDALEDGERGSSKGHSAIGGTLRRPPTLVSPSRSVLVLCKKVFPKSKHTGAPTDPGRCPSIAPTCSPSSLLCPSGHTALAMILPKMNSLSCLNLLIKKKFFGTCLGRCQWIAAGQLG